MRISVYPYLRYTTSKSEEIDRRENAELIREINEKLAPRSPRGGGRGGGGGGGGKGSSGGGSRGGSSSSGGSNSGGGGSRGGVSFGGGGSRGSSSYSAGGGSRSTVPSGVFAGRTIGGGTRDQVYGSSRYGSGYTYGGGSSVAGRGFPFGYWPVYLPIAGGTYYGYHEYGPAKNSSRPGGEMQQALVRSSSWPTANARRWLIKGRQINNGTNSTTPISTPINNTTASYYIVGDADTIAAVMQELVNACSVVHASGTAVDENNSTVHLEQAVQYYRSSSFMLALTSYNNTANLPSHAPTDNNTAAPDVTADTALPPGTDMDFLNCLNATIGASIPIMNSAAPRALHAFEGTNVVGMVWLLIWLLKIV